MNRFFTLLLVASYLTAVGQVEFPWNPDTNDDGIVGAEDLLGLLSVYNGEWDLPDPTGWATTTVNALLQFETELTALSDSLQQVQLELELLQNQVINDYNDIVVNHLDNGCYYMPGNNQTLQEGCTWVSLYAWDFNAYGGSLTLTSAGREEGDIITVHYACRNGNSGNWSTKDSSGNTIANCGPWGGTGWVGAPYRWHKTFLFTDNGWAVAY